MPAALDANPLVRTGQLPLFDKITAADVEPAMTYLLDALDEALTAFESGVEPTWESLGEGLHTLTEPSEFAWGVVNHLMAVRNSPELRAAHEKVQPRVVQMNLRVKQSRPIYDALVILSKSEDWKRLSEARKRIVESLIRQRELAGVSLEEQDRAAFESLAKESAELSTRFENNALDARKEYVLVLTSPDEVKGVPLMALELAAATARTSGASEASADSGPWHFTLDLPSLLPFLKDAERADLREQMYRAFATLASSGKTDNQPLIERSLIVRKEIARLLGFKTYAEVSLASKMAGDVEAVEELLDEVQAAALPRSRSEIDELTAFARENLSDPAFEPQPWDVYFWSERMRESRFDYTDEMLRPYFPLESALDGLFSLCDQLFGIQITSADGETPVWHESVRFFRVDDDKGQRIASFFLDPYTRPSDKRGGAWMNTCISRKRSSDDTVRQPVAYLQCNQTPPVGDKPSLMSFGEVMTLFHEFGHGLQHMLTTVDEPQAAGIANVEWDAVEIASTFMENWLYRKQTLLGFAKHFETGEPLPEELFEKLAGSRTFMSGTMSSRQISLSKVDLELHHRFDPVIDGSATERAQEVHRRNNVLPPLEEERSLCAFSHIFAGSYAAGYYSYLWARVLSSDAFGAFEDAGLDDDSSIAATGRRYRDTILAEGGGRHPMDVFKSFRGRGPSTEPMLKALGLKEASQT